MTELEILNLGGPWGAMVALWAIVWRTVVRNGHGNVAESLRALNDRLGTIEKHTTQLSVNAQILTQLLPLQVEEHRRHHEKLEEIMTEVRDDIRETKLALRQK